MERRSGGWTPYFAALAPGRAETNNFVYTQDQLPNEGALFSFPLPPAR
jgi:hypothetical protein